MGEGGGEGEQGEFDRVVSIGNLARRQHQNTTAAARAINQIKHLRVCISGLSGVNSSMQITPVNVCRCGCEWVETRVSMRTRIGSEDVRGAQACSINHRTHPSRQNPPRLTTRNQPDPIHHLCTHIRARPPPPRRRQPASCPRPQWPSPPPRAHPPRCRCCTACTLLLLLLRPRRRAQGNPPPQPQQS